MSGIFSLGIILLLLAGIRNGIKENNFIEICKRNKYQYHLMNIVRTPVKLTTSYRSKLTTDFAGEDFQFHTCFGGY